MLNQTQIINPDRLLNRIKKNAGCWEFQGYRDRDGYGQIRIGSAKDKSRKMVKAHRVSFSIFNGVSLEEMKGKVVMHRCDNPACICPKHLKLGTQKENVQDMMVKHRAAWQQA